MAFTYRGHTNTGAYTLPFSGVGIPFDPLGSPADRSGITLHESGYLPANADWNYTSVCSPFWRLCFNGARGHCVLFGERMVELTPDALMLIPPHCLFHCLGQNPVPTFWLLFNFTRQLQPAHTPPILLTPRPLDLCLIDELKRLIDEDETWDPKEAIRLHSLALLQVTLCRRELHWRAPASPRLEQVRSHIYRQFHQPLGNPELARMAGMGLARFIHEFTEAFGVTPARYVCETRVREVARLLVGGNRSLDEIATLTGFPNRDYLSRVFRKITSESPAAFRRRLIGENRTADGGGLTRI